MLAWALAQRGLHGPARSSPFGEPPLTVFSTERMYIEVLTWLDGTTAVHQHGFSGAFGVLAGSSVQTRYAWAEERRVNTRFKLGTLVPESVEALHVGDVRPIHGGAALIHSVFHLERPSATVVVRDMGDKRHSPQYVYMPPHVAFDPNTNPLLDKQRAAVVALHAIDPQCASEALLRQVAEADLEETYGWLAAALSLFGRGVAERDVVPAARERHGEVVDRLWLTQLEARRRTVLQQRRQAVTGAHHRKVLAALLIGSDQRHVLDIVGHLVPNQPPRSTISRWLADLTDEKEALVAGSLGLELEESDLTVLEAMIDGLPLEGVMARLKDEYDAEEIEAYAEHIAALFGLLRRSPVFGALLTPPWAGPA